MYKKAAFTILFLLILKLIPAQDLPASADSILKDAFESATKENKKVFIIFHASWCTWCRRMDSSLNDVSCKKFFTDNFIIRHMTVHETAKRKNEETPGGLAIITKYKGERLGLPFWLILDKNGNLLADARINPNAIKEEEINTGCPATEEEVNYFIEVLKKTTSLKNDELEIIRKRFRKNDIGFK